MLHSVKDALAACGGGVRALFQAADEDAEKPTRQVYVDTSKSTRLSWYTNSGGGTTGTHLDSTLTSLRDQEFGLRSELARAGITPMEFRPDGSTIDGLD